MRLVDPSQVGKLMKYYGFSAPDMTITEFVEDELTDIPAVPVVRCRECARAEESVHPNTVVCVEHGKTMLESDFCSYGEKAN